MSLGYVFATIIICGLLMAEGNSIIMSLIASAVIAGMYWIVNDVSKIKDDLESIKRK